MAQEDVHHLDDAGLALGLSLGGGASGAARHGISSSRLSREEARLPSPRPLEPSLTLSMPDEATATATGSGGGGGAAHSVSSLSVAGVKWERVDDAEGERASSTAAAARASASASAGAEDDDDGSTRKKLRLTKEQSALLEDRFKEHSTLNPKQKVALAKQLNLRPRQVEVWFQNRRARTKLKQTEVDCELLKRCCESLTEENRRLQRELQELRALKFAGPVHPQAPPPPQPSAGQAAAPFYMQMQMQLPVPAATLSLCPSCERLGGPAAAKAEPDRPKAATHHFFNPFTHSAAC